MLDNICLYIVSGYISVLTTVHAEVADINPCERVNFASNSVFDENPKFVDLGLSPAHTTDKLKFFIGPATRAEVWLDHSNWIASRHRISEVTADRLSEAKAYSDYIKNSDFETMNFFEQENDSGTPLNQNISRINPDT